MHTELSPSDLKPSDYQWNPFYVRKSHVESYSFCPRQFHLQYVQEVQPFENYAMSSGTRFHNFAETFFDVAPDYNPEDWISFIPKQFGTYERGMVINFIAYEINRLRNLVDKSYFVPAYREIDVYSDTHLLSGQVDRVDWFDRDNNLVDVIEYKTSSKVDEVSLKRQLGFYTILIEEDLGLTVNSVKLINPRLDVYLDFGRPDTTLPLKWADKIRTAYYDPYAGIGKCSPAKYAVCQLCKSTDEAGLFSDLEWDGEY